MRNLPVLLLLLAASPTAWTQGFGIPILPAEVQAAQCLANASVPALLRVESLSELVGDVTLNCTGGIPTQAGAQIPTANIQVFLNTNVTSRILTTTDTWSEALLMFDEPHSTQNPNTPLTVCGAPGTNENPQAPGRCVLFGTGDGNNIYSGTTALPAPGQVFSPDARPNVFQGRIIAGNSVLFAGVPIEAAGGIGRTRTIRITNVRVNAAQAGLSRTLVPNQITMFISITGTQLIPVNNPSQIVGYVVPGMTSEVRWPANFYQCRSQNAALFRREVAAPTPNSVTAAEGVAGDQGFQLVMRANEGFPSAFKRRNISQRNPLGTSPLPGFDQNQNVPGAQYNTESGFVNIVPQLDPDPNPPGQSVLSGGSVPPTNPFPQVRGLPRAGRADQGTRISYLINNVPLGLTLYVPAVVPVRSQLSNAITGNAALTQVTDLAGNGEFTAFQANAAGLVAVPVFNGTIAVVYEIVFSDAANPEYVDVPVSVAYEANTPRDLPSAGVPTLVTIGFAPSGITGAASTSAPIPRFVPPSNSQALFLVQKCDCHILFPWVTNRAGFDTAIVISNTSFDTDTGIDKRANFGTVPQFGNVRIHYFCGQPGCTSPASQRTLSPVLPGDQLMFSLGAGGNYGLAPTPDFQGYLVAHAEFQYCHAFAYISDGGTADRNFTTVGYLGLIMNRPGLLRTFWPNETLRP
jgi:hypothetical protein